VPVITVILQPIRQDARIMAYSHDERRVCNAGPSRQGWVSEDGCEEITDASAYAPAAQDRGKGLIDDRLVGMVDCMPPFPESAFRLMRLTADINCQPKALVQAIACDPVMTMNILKLVNSAYFSLSRHVSSVQHALIYLGMNTVKNLAISVATMDNLPRWALGSFTSSGFLLHSVLTGRLAQRLAGHFGQAGDNSEAFVAGLLHDFGKAVFAHAEPVRYAAVLKQAAAGGMALHVVEREAFGFDHAGVGAKLADQWQLPARLVQGIAGHHADAPAGDSLNDFVMAANILANGLLPGISGNTVVAMPGSLCARLGMDLAALQCCLDDLETEVEQTRVLLST
jgi:putative nucleotidyltransferase with HDIG domain